MSVPFWEQKHVTPTENMLTSPFCEGIVYYGIVLFLRDIDWLSRGLQEDLALRQCFCVVAHKRRCA